MAHVIGNSRCLRCHSKDVKFRYYNNKSAKQPRYWCNKCKKFYTHGGKVRKTPRSVVDRKQRAPSKSMGGAEEGGEPCVNVVQDEHGADSVNIENKEEKNLEFDSQQSGIKRASSADESRDQLVPTLGALRAQRRKGTPVKALPK